MNTKKLPRLITLSVFVILVSGFVAYRSGVFDRYTKPTAIETAPLLLTADYDTTKPKKKEEDTTISIMYSSKSMIMVDENMRKRKKDSTHKAVMNRAELRKAFKSKKKKDSTNTPSKQ